MRIAWVISLITAVGLVAACSSDPIGRITVPKDDDGRGSTKTPPKTTDQEADDDAVVIAEEVDASLPDTGLPPPPPPNGSSTPPKQEPAPGAIGTQCQNGDAKEISGQLTPITSSACGELSESGDEDFYSFKVATATTLTLRIGAEGDAVARLETPNGNVIVVSSAGTANVGSAAGTAVIRVRSRTGALQDYRIVVQ